MPADTLIISPILNSNTDPGMHYFKVCYRDVVELRIIKEKLMKKLDEGGFVVEDKKGWYEE